MNTTVDTTKWEEIDFEDIELGDKVKSVVKYNSADSTAVGTITGINYEGAFKAGEVVLISHPNTLRGISSFISRKLYREIKPFDFPTQLGTVIEAKSKLTGATRRFVRIDTGWTKADTGAYYTNAEIVSGFSRPTLLKRGLTDA